MLITFRQNNIIYKINLHNYCGLKKTYKIIIDFKLSIIYHEKAKKSIYLLTFFYKFIFVN